MKKIRRCQACLSYTLEPTHCGLAAKSVHPPPYKLRDKFADYRRKAAGLESNENTFKSG